MKIKHGEQTANNNPRLLPGFLKESFQMPYGGGYIWFEHLDGIYENTNLVLEKLKKDAVQFCRPSISSLICVNFEETVLKDEVIEAFINAILGADKAFKKICFVGVDTHYIMKFKKPLARKGFAITFINDFEKAKEWLIS